MQIFGLTGWRRLLGCALAFAVSSNASVIIQLTVVEGEGMVYRTGARAARGLTVLVTDEAGKPVPNASVSFRLPESGPSGLFTSGLRTEIVTTGADGRASVGGMLWNKTAGPVEIHITAVKDQARAGIISTQYLNETAAPQAALKPASQAALKPASKPAPKAALKAAPKPALQATPQAVTQPATQTALQPATQTALQAATQTALQGEPKAAPQAGSEGVFKASHKSKTKWLVIGALVGGAAAAGMVFGQSHGAAPAAASPPGLSIGTPSIIVGHP
ncbi:MAG TPA: hypothetical protein VMH05_16670 [Bryobacteraceae bacterium]|nr:hypothetical protein [Bryobacteraceae bacterium]